MSAAAVKHGELTTLRRRFDVLTPEGVPLALQLASPGRRLIAFLIDFIVICLLLFGATILVVSVSSVVNDGFIAAMFLVGWFFLVNFYFPYFEHAKGGVTPGKRLVGIRVVSRSGGSLELRSVVARNFLRDLELWIPLQVIVLKDQLYGGVPDWAMPIMVLWVLGLLFYPLFNKDHQRLGDLVGGTVVVDLPVLRLLRDLSDSKAQAKVVRSSGLLFTKNHLSHYGVFELQVLEDLLRLGRRADRQSIGIVAQKVKKKIAWTGEKKISDRDFLGEFYRAQRAHLEEQMLLGNRREKKDDI